MAGLVPASSDMRIADYLDVGCPRLRAPRNDSSEFFGYLNRRLPAYSLENPIARVILPQVATSLLK